MIKKPYLGVHLRRGDFLYAHKDVLPQAQHSLAQMREFMTNYSLKAVFLATDAREDDSDFKDLGKSKVKFYRYPGGKGLDNISKKKPKFSEGIV